MIVERHSLYTMRAKLISANTPDLVAFDMHQYSRFKHGSRRSARVYADQLLSFAQKHIFEVNRELMDVYVASSAYKNLPTAATGIAINFYRQLKRVTGDNLKPKLFRIHRSVVVAGDYAKLSELERQNIMAGHGLYLQKSEQFVGKTIIIIDDIRITGSHEEAILSLLSNHGVARVYFLYVVDVDLGSTDPSIEHFLNSISVKHLTDLGQLMKNEPFIITARVCKLFLGSSRNQCKNFLISLDSGWLQDLQESIIIDGYEKMPQYAGNFDLIQQTLDLRWQLAASIPQ